MEKTNVVVGGNVEGNITSCKIETSPIKVDKQSIYSLQQTTTYRSYDVCTKQIVSEYRIPELTSFGGLFAFCSAVGVFLLVGLFMSVISSR